MSGDELESSLGSIGIPVTSGAKHTGTFSPKNQIRNAMFAGAAPSCCDCINHLKLKVE